MQLSLRWHVCEDFYVRKPANTQVEIVDKRLKNMMKELGDAINNSLSDSDEIAEVISRIKDGGYDVFVVLEATIGFNQQNDDEDQATETEHASAEFKMTSQDMKFLKSLRISVGEER
jgi:cell division GTPase FtsZ